MGIVPLTTVGGMPRSCDNRHRVKFGKYGHSHEIQGVLDEVRCENGADLRRISWRILLTTLGASAEETTVGSAQE